MFDARDCMFWWGVQLGMVALELGPLGRYAFSSAGGDSKGFKFGILYRLLIPCQMAF
jgi:hypothetical protein